MVASRGIFRAVAVTLVISSLLDSSARAAGTIYDLGTLGGTTKGWAINSSGQVAGSSYLTGDTVNRAFLYTGTPGVNGQMTDLGTLGGTYGAGLAINNSGQMTGYAQRTDTNEHAFRYTGVPGSGGAMADLGTLGGVWSDGFGINSVGQVVGKSKTSGFAAHAFLYTGIPGSDGAMADLGTLGDPAGDSDALAINTSGQVTGSSQGLGGPSGPFNEVSYAFLYTGVPGQGGAMATLGVLSGGAFSEGDAINDGGQVTGTSNTKVNGVFDENHVFLYTGIPGSGGSMADLGTLGGAYGKGLAINDNGQIVGESSYVSGSDVNHAFLYTGTPGADGHMIDLDTWLDSVNPTEGAKWTLSSATGLTDSGLITGYGSYNDGPGGLSDGTRAFLLDASALVPEPGSLSLLGLSVLAMLGGCRALRRRTT